MGTLIALIVGYAIFSGYRTADAASNIMFNIDTVDFKGINGGGADFVLNCTARNPTSKSIELEYIYADLTLNGKSIGKVDLGQNNLPADLREMMTIKLNSSNKIKIPVRIGFTQLAIAVGAQAISFLTAGFDLAALLPKDCGVEGYTKANGIRANFKQTVPLSKP